MDKTIRVGSPIYPFSSIDIEGFDSLAELAWICAGRGIIPLMRYGNRLILRPFSDGLPELTGIE